jgi:hypothetical protein
MSMAKRDYELIADVFRRELADLHRNDMSPAWYQAARQSLCNCAFTLAHALRQANPNFDRNVFLKACGVTAE